MAPHDKGQDTRRQPMPEELADPDSPDQDDPRGSVPMTGTTPTETATTTPGGDLYPASPGTDSWAQADETEESERATGS